MMSLSDNIYVACKAVNLYGSSSFGSFLVKYNPSGIKQWNQHLGASYSTSANGVAFGESGNIYVVGVTANQLDGSTNLGGSDLFVIKYNSNGTKQ